MLSLSPQWNKAKRHKGHTRNECSLLRNDLTFPYFIATFIIPGRYILNGKHNPPKPSFIVKSNASYTRGIKEDVRQHMEASRISR